MEIWNKLRKELIAKVDFEKKMIIILADEEFEVLQ